MRRLLPLPLLLAATACLSGGGYMSAEVVYAEPPVAVYEVPVDRVVVVSREVLVSRGYVVYHVARRGPNRVIWARRGDDEVVRLFVTPQGDRAAPRRSSQRHRPTHRTRSPQAFRTLPGGVAPRSVDGTAARFYYRPVPYLKLVALATGRSIEAREPVVRLGRDPGSTIVFSGDEANVVSARHAEVRHTSGGWHLVDLGSRNGTLVNGARVTGAVPLKVGDKISLGDSGPKLTVAAVTEEVAPTVAEHPAIEMRAYAVSLRGTDFASMAQRDQGAVGLITVSLGRQYYSGSGFV